jgi:hypothetical protein
MNVCEPSKRDLLFGMNALRRPRVGGIVLIFAWVACCLAVVGQTNSPPTAPGLFSVPKAHLRPAASEPDTAIRAESPGSKKEAEPPFARPASLLAAPSAAESRAPADKLALDAGGDFFNPGLYRQLVEEGCLTQRSPPSALERRINDIFVPEVIHFRKADLSCSLITAIKRKNPLCLLNPIFLDLSW